jgi:hypothetical protein
VISIGSELQADTLRREVVAIGIDDAIELPRAGLRFLLRSGQDFMADRVQLREPSTGFRQSLAVTGQI